MKQKSLKLVNQNLQEYYKRMRFYKKRLEKTLPFVLVQQKLVPTVAMALQLISQGNVRINNRTKKDPRYVCKPKDSVSVKSQSILATAVAPQVTVASTKPQITEASTKPQVTATAAKKQANKASAKPQVNATAAKKQANKASAAKAA
jgi:ribosomal protein S4